MKKYYIRVVVGGFEPPTSCPVCCYIIAAVLYQVLFQLSYTTYHYVYCFLPSTKLCEEATPHFCLSALSQTAISSHALLVLALWLL